MGLAYPSTPSPGTSMGLVGRNGRPLALASQVGPWLAVLQVELGRLSRLDVC